MIVSQEIPVRLCPVQCEHCALNRVGKAYCRLHHRMLGKAITKERATCRIPGLAWLSRWTWLFPPVEVIRHRRLHICTHVLPEDKEYPARE